MIPARIELAFRDSESRVLTVILWNLRTRGIEHRLEPWKGSVLPLYYGRINLTWRNRTTDLRIFDYPCLDSRAYSPPLYQLS